MLPAMKTSSENFLFSSNRAIDKKTAIISAIHPFVFQTSFLTVHFFIESSYNQGQLQNVECFLFNFLLADFYFYSCPLSVGGLISILKENEAFKHSGCLCIAILFLFFFSPLCSSILFQKISLETPPLVFFFFVYQFHSSVGF